MNLAYNSAESTVLIGPRLSKLKLIESPIQKCHLKRVWIAECPPLGLLYLLVINQISQMIFKIRLTSHFICLHNQFYQLRNHYFDFVFFGTKSELFVFVISRLIFSLVALFTIGLIWGRRKGGACNYSLNPLSRIRISIKKYIVQYGQCPYWARGLAVCVRQSNCVKK